MCDGCKDGCACRDEAEALKDVIRKEYREAYAAWSRARARMEAVVIDGLTDNGYAVAREHGKRDALRRVENIARAAGIEIKERKGI